MVRAVWTEFHPGRARFSISEPEAEAVEDVPDHRFLSLAQIGAGMSTLHRLADLVNPLPIFWTEKMPVLTQDSHLLQRR